MSLADEVLANHIKDGADCLICMFPWPCAAVRLATQLRAAEQVVTAAREFHHAMNECCPCDDEGDCLFAVRLAEYDKGGRE